MNAFYLLKCNKRHIITIEENKNEKILIQYLTKNVIFKSNLSFLLN